MTSNPRPHRKRKQSEQFSPMHPEEEKQLMEALTVSLRKIPENGSVSEDDCDETDSKETYLEDEEHDDEEQKGDDYEIKWRDTAQQLTLIEFSQPSGPTKVIASSQKEK